MNTLPYLPNEIVNIILSFRPPHPTAIMIRDEYNELKNMATQLIDRCYPAEYIIMPIENGFWSLVDTLDGDIPYKNWGRNWATKMLYHNREIDEDMNMPFAEEYEIIKREAIEDGNWVDKTLINDGLVQRLKQNKYL